MTPAALLARARSLGIRVAEEGGHLRVDGDALTDDLVAEFRAAKPEILALLRSEGKRAREDAAASADAGYEVAERLATQEEGCTPSELEALRGPAAGTDSATRRYVNPDLDAEDLALLRACERLDDARSALRTASTCQRGSSRDGRGICRRSHSTVAVADAKATAAAKDSA